MAAVTSAALTVLMPVGAAHAETRTAPVGVSSAAWYSRSPACSLPADCAPGTLPTGSTYPAGTLHIGLVAGIETARTYLALTVAPVPKQYAVTASLVLPLAGGDAGTSNPTVAHVEACLAAERLAADPASADHAPPIDCSVRVRAAFRGGGQPALTIDLLPFLQAWRGGFPDHGIALLPADAGQPTDAWHLAFRGPGGAYRGSPPISGVVRFDLGSQTGTTASPSSGSAPTGRYISGATPPMPFLPSTSGAPEVAPGTQAPQVNVGGRAQPAADATSTGYRYPAVFLLPLALLALGGLLRKSFVAPLGALSEERSAVTPLDRLLSDLASRSHR